MFDLGDRSADVLPITAETLTERLGLSSMGETLQFGARQGACVAPTTTAELAQTLLAHPEATIVAGATDVGLWVTKSLKELKSTVHVGAIAEMRRISETADALTIGGAATFADAQPALARLYPDFGELIRRIGGEQVRTVGTIGGNIANGSPIGDSPPALIAIGASIILRRGDERRRIAIEDFFIAYGRQDRRPSEFVEAISLPKPTPNAHFRAYKISKRFDQDISALCGAFLVELSGGVATRVRIAFGGMAGTPKRAAAAEAALLGRPWTLETVEAAMAALRTDYAPLSDWRASSAYRLTVAANLLLKFFSETTGAAGTRLVGQGRLVHA
jgi:xanthine dehydrogenase small subunit